MAMFSVSWLAGERRILPTLSTMLNMRFPLDTRRVGRRAILP